MRLEQSALSDRSLRFWCGATWPVTASHAVFHGSGQETLISAPDADFQDEPRRHLPNRSMKALGRLLYLKLTAANRPVCFGPIPLPIAALVLVAPGRQAAASGLGRTCTRRLSCMSTPVHWSRRFIALAGLQEEEIRRGEDNDHNHAPRDHGACDLLRSGTSSRLSF